jgi:hypothetical protein
MCGFCVNVFEADNRGNKVEVAVYKDERGVRTRCDSRRDGLDGRRLDCESISTRSRQLNNRQDQSKANGYNAELLVVVWDQRLIEI